jgi:hypothetical protein
MNNLFPGAVKLDTLELTLQSENLKPPQQTEKTLVISCEKHEDLMNLLGIDAVSTRSTRGKSG